jgi:hypothetical protein
MGFIRKYGSTIIGVVIGFGGVEYINRTGGSVGLVEFAAILFLAALSGLVFSVLKNL